MGYAKPARGTVGLESSHAPCPRKNLRSGQGIGSHEENDTSNPGKPSSEPEGNTRANALRVIDSKSVPHFPRTSETRIRRASSR